MELEPHCCNYADLRFERIDFAQNIHRYYHLSWEPTLLESGAVVRRYGRIGGPQHVMSPEPFPSLDEAWPFIRAIIRRRLRHGYRIVGPEHGFGA